MTEIMGSRGESTSVTIDAKGLGCARPVILAKNALKMYDDVAIVVDERPALENLKALGMHSGCAVEITEEPIGGYRIYLRKTS